MKLTLEQLADIASGPVNGFGLDCAEATALLDHIREVEAERDGVWQLTVKLALAARNRQRDGGMRAYLDVRDALADYDALVAREGASNVQD